MSVKPAVLVQLPNKDLWRGFDPDFNPKAAKGNVEMNPSPDSTPKVEGKDCLWCGMKFDTNELLKEHVEHLHFASMHFKEVAREFLSANQVQRGPGGAEKDSK